MRARHYAQALIELLSDARSKGADEAMISDTIRMMIANGHQAQLGKFAKLTEKLLKKKEKRRTITVSSVTALSEENMDDAIRKAKEHGIFREGEHVAENVVDNTLIGGSVITTSSMRITRSHRRNLEDLYSHIVNARS